LECAFGALRKMLMSKISWNLFDKIWIQYVGDIDISKQCSYVEFPYFVMGSHLGQQHRPHQSIYEGR